MQQAEPFDRLTPEAKHVLSLAQEEAQRFNHNYIGTEHLLLGLARLDEGVSATVLKNLDVKLSKVSSAVEFIIGRGDRIVLGQIGLTPRSKKVIEFAFDEAKQMQQENVAPEHLLLGLVREGEGIAAGVLESLGVNLWRIRQETYRVLGLPLPEDEPEEPAPYEPEPPVSWNHHPDVEVLSRFFAGASISAVSPLPPQVAPIRRYRPWHIDAEQHQKTAVGNGTESRMVFGPMFGGIQQGSAIGTLLGWVVVNTGGAFTLTLYDSLADDAPSLAVIRQPPTGACFQFHCIAKQGLTYTLEGTPGSVTIIYDELKA